MLARELGMSVKRCQQEVDSQEFAEWMAEHRLSPLGRERDDLHAAMAAAASSGTKVEDWMPHYGPKEAPTPEELQDKADRMFERMPKKRKRK